MASSMGFSYSISLLSAIRATGLLAFTLAGLFPAEHVYLFWTHVGSRAGAVMCRRTHLLPSLSVDGASLVSPSPRFQPPPRRTQRADLPHYALLLAWCQGLWDLSAGRAFVVGLLSRYPLKSPSCLCSHSLLHRFQPQPDRFLARIRCLLPFFSTHRLTEPKHRPECPIA